MYSTTKGTSISNSDGRWSGNGWIFEWPWAWWIYVVVIVVLLIQCLFIIAVCVCLSGNINKRRKATDKTIKAQMHMEFNDNNCNGKNSIISENNNVDTNG